MVGALWKILRLPIRTVGADSGRSTSTPQSAERLLLSNAFLLRFDPKIRANKSFRNSDTLFKFYAQVCHFDTCVGSSSDEEEQQRWNEDPFSGRLSVVDSAFSTLPPHLIDKHWNWVTILDLSRNHIKLSIVHKVSCLVRLS